MVSGGRRGRDNGEGEDISREVGEVRPSRPGGKGEEREKDHIIFSFSDKFYMVFHVGAVMGEALWSLGEEKALYALAERGAGTKGRKKKRKTKLRQMSESRI